jgi:coenzyme PQQ precursor peptide PqqA
MNTAEPVEVWVTPDFEEISASMECTAYAQTLED